MPPLVQALRPVQWVKNLAVLAGVVFGGVATEPGPLLRALATTFLFCLAASAVYLGNDVADRERDRLHPRKRLRPVAAGTLAPGTALAAAAILALVAAALAALLDRRVLGCVAGYLLLQAAYSLKLKHLVVLDLFAIAGGFLLRVLAGVAAAGVLPSPWLVACTVQLALFLALCKRRAEVAALGPDGNPARRPVLAGYSGPATDLMVGVLAASTLVSYALYTLLPARILVDPALPLESRAGMPGMVWTLPWVLFGVLRYLFLVYGQARGQRPEALLFGDPPLLGAVLGYAATAAWVIYHHGP